MQVFEFTTEATGEGDQITSVATRIADRPDEAEQSEWIAFQLAVGMPTVLNGALQRAKALKRASEILAQLADRFERLGNAR